MTKRNFRSPWLAVAAFALLTSCAPSRRAMGTVEWTWSGDDRQALADKARREYAAAELARVQREYEMAEGTTNSAVGLPNK